MQYVLLGHRVQGPMQFRSRTPLSLSNILRQYQVVNRLYAQSNQTKQFYGRPLWYMFYALFELIEQ